MKYNLLISLTLSVAMAAACNKIETTTPSLPDGYEPSNTPISFETEDNWGDVKHSPKLQNSVATKGFETNTGNFDDFGVLAYYMKSDEDISITTPNFMYNEEVTKNGNEPWSYSPIKYWSNNENDKIQFFAYHPYNSTSIVLSGNSEVGTPEFTVTPDHRPFDQVDIITASTAPLKKCDEISLAFSHKLAQVRLYAAHCGSGAIVKVISVEVKGFRSTGKLIYNENAPSDDVDKMIWEHQQGKDEIPPGDTEIGSYLFLRSITDDDKNELRKYEEINYLEGPSPSKDSYTLLGKNGAAYLMLVPQKNIGEVVIEVFFSYELNGSTVQSNEEFVIPTRTTTLEENEIKNYLLLINPKGIGFGTINITSEPWDDWTIAKDFEIE